MEGDGKRRKYGRRKGERDVREVRRKGMERGRLRIRWRLGKEEGWKGRDGRSGVGWEGREL